MLTEDVKAKVEKYAREEWGASSVIWGEDYCTIFDEQDKGIEDLMIDIDDDGSIYCTPVSEWRVSLKVE